MIAFALLFFKWESVADKRSFGNFSVGQLKAELKKEIQSTFEEIDFWIESWKSQLRGIRQKSDKVLVCIEH